MHKSSFETAAAKSPASRILEMDALRGLAAVAVVLFHYTTRYEELFGHSEPLSASVPWGHYGVDLFFMLSGFVILMTLERTADSLKFAWGRFSRLYPTYWAAAALTFLVVTCCGLPGQEVSLGDALVNLTMVQALLGSPHIDGAYWSLQAELIFYANMLVLFRLGAFRRPALTVLAWLALAAVVTTLQSYLLTEWNVTTGLLSKLATLGSLKFIPLFGVGVLLYHAERTGYAWQSRLGLAACMLVVGWREGSATLVVDAFLATLLWLAVSRRLPFLTARPLVWLGTVSYSLYLIHQNIGYVLIRSLESVGMAPLVAIAFASAMALLLAAYLHRWVERPTMQLFRKVDFGVLAGRSRTATANS
jgi:peptidoglycan/LPS O-acetylase OafA/YrhL